jgi:hypothetical protein
MRVMACMHVSNVQHDGFQLRASVVFGLKEPHPHVMSVVVDEEQAIAYAMWGGDGHWISKAIGHVRKGTGWFSASISVAWCNSGLVEQA